MRKKTSLQSPFKKGEQRLPSLKKRKEILQNSLQRLRILYPQAHCELIHQNPFELMISVQLSAQCTDARVNQITPKLFERIKYWEDLATIAQEELEQYIYSTGFYRNKARNLIGCAQGVLGEFQGKLPETLKELIKLPGVGRKTANVVLQTAFGKTEGIVVDTHVTRIARKLHLTTSKNAIRIEKDLEEVCPQKDWAEIGDLFVWYGRKMCTAHHHSCDCLLSDLY